MAETSKYIPIEGLVTPKVRVDLPLPSYIDQAQIGLHLGKVRTLCRLGGISHLRITGHIGDETSTSMSVMVGFNSQGGGYAGKLGTKIDIPTYRSSRSSRAPLEGLLGVPHSARWVDGVISANIDEITQRINSDKTGDIRSTQAWASHLDQAVRAGVRDIGTYHLTMGLNKGDYGLAALTYVAFISSYIAIDFLTGAMVNLITGKASENEIKIPTGYDLPLNFLFMSLFMNSVNFLQYHPRFNQGREEGSRLSLIYGPQLDRALILQALSARKNVIKSLEV